MRGKALALSRPRRLIGDLMHFSAGVPTNPVQRRMLLGPVLEARAESSVRLSWQALFLKAYAIVCDDFPQLRQAYVKCPWPHLYEYPRSVATVTVERDYQGESVPFMGRIKDPAARSLLELDAALRSFRDTPLDEVKSFRRALAISRWPRPLRRLLWWIGLNIGRQRANYFGTFGLTVLSSLGTESLHPLSPLTTTLCYGVIQSDGSVDVRLSYDHRVLDGAVVARALNRLERVMLTTIRTELLEEVRTLPKPANVVAI